MEARGKHAAFSKARWARSVRPRCRQLPQGPSVCDKMTPREGVDRPVLGLLSTGGTTMFASKPPTCTGRTLDLSRKDSDIRNLRHLGNSDIAKNFPNPTSELPEHRLFSILRHPHHVISAIPSDVGLALPLSHDDLLPELGSSRLETVVSGSSNPYNG